MKTLQPRQGERRQSYVKDVEADRRERKYDRWTERLGWLVVLLCVGVGSYLGGQYRQLHLATRAYNNAESAVRMLEVCTDQMARTMSVVLAEDAKLHQTLRELPPVVWVQP